jgi:glycosyltransferase involved in cell wall biosynthesis
LGQVNGVEYVVDMAKAALAQDAHDLYFVVVGEGREREKVLAHARGAGVLDVNFELREPLPKTMMPAVLAAASVACSVVIDVPALWHNSANKFFDALAAGVPMLINHEGWQADLLRESGAGLVVPPHDPARAVADLVALVGDDGRLAAAGAAAARLADRSFDRDLLARQLLRTLEEAIADPSLPRLKVPLALSHS